ncbi:MAG: asparaginase [Rubrivivax sp.]
MMQTMASAQAHGLGAGGSGHVHVADGPDAEVPVAVRRVVVLGTGGTIAGVAASATDNVGYASAQRGVADLLAAVPALARFHVEAAPVAQVDSSDMRHEIWSALARRCAAHLARPEVDGVVITHGTDTLEETAWLLHRVLGAAVGSLSGDDRAGGHTPHKPVVLTAAMRPATSLQADGPQNLLDAVTVAAEPGAGGVLLALAGQVWAGAEVRKVHTWRLEAFEAGDAGPVALLREGRVAPLRPWPGFRVPVDPSAWPAVPAAADLPAQDDAWPWVEIVASHAGARPRAVQALRAGGVRGLVVACTGNGSVHESLEAVLRAACADGVPVLRATRCAGGGIVEPGAEPLSAAPDVQGGAPATTSARLPSAGHLTPAQARVELMLRLLGAAGRAG